MLNAHNNYRLIHCAPFLTLDDDINYSAQKYADYLADSNTFNHTNTLDLGENILKVSSSKEINNFDGSIATDYWYNETISYNFEDAKYSTKTGHFTQVVWKDSERLGVGYATVKRESRYILYVVAQYSPAGNVDGLFSKNVFPPVC